MIIPGLLEQDFAEIKRKIYLVQDVSKIIQIDINDGTLFEGSTFLEANLLANLVTPSSFELHLMVQNPLEYVQRKIPNVSKVVCQVEAENISEFIAAAKQLGYVVGLSVDADTNSSALNRYLHDIAYVQFMTIKTGKSAQPFRPDVLDKIQSFFMRNPGIRLQNDGGSNEHTIPLLHKKGIRDFAVTSAIFSTQKPAESKLALEELAHNYV